MNIIDTALPGVLLIEPRIFSDQRGFFYESFNADRYRQYGITLNFVQDNFSHSTKNVLRGLHYQHEHTQGKLIGITAGRIFDVIVDIRFGSPYFGQSIQVVLDATKPQQLYIPPGFAHGFCVLSEEVDFYYKCTEYYHPASEKGVIWNDPDLMIPWPIDTPVLSEKDARHLQLKNISPEELPKYSHN